VSATEPAVKLATFDDVLRALDNLAPHARVEGPWNLPQVLAHCAQSIDYSLSGFPELRGALFRATAGRLAARTFLKRGFFHHELTAPIPGAPVPEASTSLDAAKAELRAAIARFRGFKGQLFPHFAYGSVARDDYEKLHAMHAADHFAAVKA
jgi:hypothetical protein